MSSAGWVWLLGRLNGQRGGWMDGGVLRGRSAEMWKGEGRWGGKEGGRRACMCAGGRGALVAQFSRGWLAWACVHQLCFPHPFPHTLFPTPPPISHASLLPLSPLPPTHLTPPCFPPHPPTPHASLLPTAPTHTSRLPASHRTPPKTHASASHHTPCRRPTAVCPRATCSCRAPNSRRKTRARRPQASATSTTWRCPTSCMPTP
eukprot:335963-Chlamydomonas_euryale.AAC.1